MNDGDLLELWYKALHAEIGVEVVCSDVGQVRVKLYAVRADSGDRALKGVSIRASPFDPNKLWLIRKRESEKEPSNA